MEDWRNSFPLRQLRVRPLASFSCAVLIGMVYAWHYDVPMPVGLVACGLALSAALMCSRRHRKTAALMLLMLAGLSAGMVRMTFAQDDFAPVETQYSVNMVGRIDTEPFTNRNTGRVIARFLPETVNGKPSRLRLRLYLRGEAEPLAQIAYGQRLSLKGHIWATDPVTNPYEFDFSEYLHRNRMDVIATAKIEDVTILDEPSNLPSQLFAFKHAAAERIDALFPRSAPMVRALVLGDRSLMSDELRESFNATGTAHLISISGLHVTFLALLLSAILRQFMPRWRANLLVLGPLMFYGVLIGFPASFVRALAMFAVLGLSSATGLPSDPVTRLCAAMLGYLLVRPLMIADAGFVLSFSASAGMILLTPPIRTLLRLDRLPKPRPGQSRWHKLCLRAAAYLSGLVSASLAAQLATLPAVIAWFGVQSVISIPFNLICVPLCMMGYVLSLSALLLSLIWLPLGAATAAFSDALLALLMSITQYSFTLPITSVRVGRYPAALVVIHVCVILAASGLSRLPMARRRYLPLGLAAVAAISTLFVWIRCLPFSVMFLDAGQADCAVLNTLGHTYVFDTGDTYTPVVDYLNANSLHLDGVFLSHPHQDHAGGLLDILESFKPDRVYVPKGWFDQEDISEAVSEGVQRAKALGIPIVELSSGDTLSLSRDVQLTVYNPDGSFSEINDMSLLLLAEAGQRSVLFTGDLTAKGEPAVIPDCEILKVAHHGADNATSERFLSASTPELAVICVGENSFGHPGEETLKRLRASGAEILRTDECGAIKATAAEDGWSVITFVEAADELE